MIWIKILLPDTKQGLLAYQQRFPFFLCWTIWVTETKSVPAERQGPQFQGWASNFEPEPCQITHQTYSYSQPLSSGNAWHKIVSYWEKGSLFIPLSVDAIKIWQTEIKLTLTSGPSESHGTFTIETTTKVVCHASSTVLTWIWLTFIFLWGSKQDSWNTINIFGSTDQKPVVRAQGGGGGGGGMEDWHVREVAWHSEMSGVCQGVRSVTRTNICFWTEFFFPFSKFPVMYNLTFVWKHSTAKLGTTPEQYFFVCGIPGVARNIFRKSPRK